MSQPDTFDFDRERVQLLARKFSPAELKVQALQATAALIVQHRTVLDHNIIVAEGVPVDQQVLLSILEFNRDITKLLMAADAINEVNSNYEGPPEAMIDHYFSSRQAWTDGQS